MAVDQLDQFRHQAWLPLALHALLRRNGTRDRTVDHRQHPKAARRDRKSITWRPPAPAGAHPLTRCALIPNLRIRTFAGKYHGLRRNNCSQAAQHGIGALRPGAARQWGGAAVHSMLFEPSFQISVTWTLTATQPAGHFRTEAGRRIRTCQLPRHRAARCATPGTLLRERMPALKGC